MTVWRVDKGARTFSGPFGTVPCAIGRGGACAADAKREGDGCTPLGLWPIRCVLIRPGCAVMPPDSTLPWRWIGAQDGWSDDPADPAYNRPVRHPHPYSAERLWRDDGAYDTVVILGHNDSPPVPARGSAIFLHCTSAKADTEGCVALNAADMQALLSLLRPGDHLSIG